MGGKCLIDFFKVLHGTFEYLLRLTRKHTDDKNKMHGKDRGNGWKKDSKHSAHYQCHTCLEINIPGSTKGAKEEEDKG